MGGSFTEYVLATLGRLLLRPFGFRIGLEPRIALIKDAHIWRLVLGMGLLLPTLRPYLAVQTSASPVRELVSRGQAAVVSGDWKAAEGYFRDAVHLEPRSAALHAQLGLVQLRLGAFQAAEASFREAIRLGPSQPSLRLGLAEVLLRQSRLDAAAAEYTKLLELDAANFDAHYNLGLLYLKQKSCQQAMAHLRRAEELSPSRPETALNLVDAHFCAGQAADADATAERVRRQWRDSPKVLYSLGLTLFRNGSFKLADGALTQAWRLLPNEPEIGLHLVRCKLALRMFSEAQTALLTIQEKTGPTDETELLLGYSYLGVGDSEAALQAFRQAASLNPRSAAAQLALGRQLFQMADVEGSVAHLREAYRLAPDDDEIITSLGQVLVKGGRFDEAIVLLGNRAGDPTVPEMLSQLAVAYASLGRFSQAAPLLEILVHRETANDRAYFLLGYIRGELGQAEGALSAYAKALRLNPRAGVYYLHCASILARQGRLDEAAEMLQKSLSLQPNSPAAHYGFGRILTQKGRYQEAVAHLEKSLTAGQPPARAYYLLATCYARLGDVVLAKQYREKFAASATQSHRDEFINLSSDDIEALSFGRSQFALPPRVGLPP